MKKILLAFTMLLAMTGLVKAQYCAPTGALDCTLGDGPTNVTFGTINNNSACGAGGYTYYSALTTNVTQGGTYPISVTVGATLDYAMVWIDYNQNNTFEVSEFKLIGTGASSAGNLTLTGNITIPLTAATGTTRMRVRVRFSTAPTGTEACNFAGLYGEVEDYNLNIISLTPCAGTPAPGNTVATVSPICAGATTTLSPQNATTGSGVTYQWQSSATGAAGSYTPIASATSNTYAATPATSTYYQLAVTCGANTGTTTALQIVVNTLPNVTMNPTTSCASATNSITASGADTYTWAPTTGLTPAAGNTPVVVANPTTTTTYTVTGKITATGCTKTATSVVNSRPTASVLSSVASSTFQINEGFAAVLPAGWSRLNNSTTPGAGVWGQGIPVASLGAFDAFNGAANSYAYCNYQSTAAVTGATIQNWMISPVLNIKNGDIVTFWSRTEVGGAAYNDQVQLRMSTNGASTNVGATATTFGDFTTVLVDINPAANASYPEAWTKYTATISGVTGTVTGRIAFRYYVSNAGTATTGANGDYIGIDQLTYETPAAAICAGTISNLTVAVTGGAGPYTVVFSDGTTNYTYPNYTSGNNINVSPAVSTTYSLVSVTGANGCTGIGNTGTATISITPAAAITAQPAAITNICTAGNANITVGTNTSVATNTYQWQVSTNGGSTYTDLTNAGVYSNVTTPTMTITGATAALNGNLYRVKVNGFCGPVGGVTSTASTLSVNTAAVITAPSAAGNFKICANTGSISATATGTALTYQWQVSTNSGGTWTNLANNANYSGVTTATLTFTNAPLSFVNNQYRVLVSSGGCTATTSPAQTLTAVNPVPVVVISAAPNTVASPSSPVTLTATVSSATSPITYQWYLNTVLVTGATGATFTPDVNAIGDYSVVVKDANGCSTAISTPFSITITRGATEPAFIYPSPNSGVFQVRFYNATATSSSTQNATVNVFDQKGSRVYTQRYVVNGPYTQMNVDLGTHARGVYRVEVADANGNRLKTGSVMIF